MRDPEVWAAVEAGPLGDLPVPVVVKLLEDATLVRAGAGSPLYKPGDPIGLHLVVSGVVRIALISPEGRQVTVRYARPSEVMGAPVVLAGSVDVVAQAVTDVVFVRTLPGQFELLAANDSRVALWLADELTRRVHGLLHELGRTAFFPVRARVARHLLDLAVNEQRGSALVARVSHQELADAVGSVREVVARTLIGLRRQGYVEQSAAGIVVLDPHALTDAAESAR